MGLPSVHPKCQWGVLPVVSLRYTRTAAMALGTNVRTLSQTLPRPFLWPCVAYFDSLGVPSLMTPRAGVAVVVVDFMLVSVLGHALGVELG